MTITRPTWTRSLRFGLALRWSLALLLVASTVVVGLNVALARTVGDVPAAETYRAVEKVRTDSGVKTLRELELAEVEDVEAATNARALATLRTYSVYALGGLFVTSLAVGWLLAGRALRPVGEMTRATTLVDGRDLSRRISVGGGDDELGSLARSIDDMLGRLDEAFGRQRQFVSDASHELRTPLAVIQTNVDAVLSRADVDPRERERAVSTTTRAVGRMATLVDDMLASARASTPEDMQPGISLDELARDELVEFEVLADARAVELRARTEPVVVTGHEAALRRAVDNLVANAVRLTREASTVRLDVGERDAWAFVAVTDAGPGVPDGEAPQVFDRFWRGRGQDSGDGHHGLGLSIVRQVAESHGGVARVHPAAGVGSTFVLWLPLTQTARATVPPAASPV
ncbi:sensor histidine kinase [Solicola sp. PLA-1-18]|uniref:sensor histidine kinase n=1 Tax=Solicola sp. PLA-1-18 TaxID=3380532 RepID=UPI003B7CF3BF